MYRKQQAMQMIKSIEIVVEELPQEEKTIKYWHIVKEEEATPVKTYVSKEEALADPESRSKMVLSAYKELRNFKKKYKELHELNAFHDLIDSLVPDKLGRQGMSDAEGCVECGKTCRVSVRQ